MPAAGIGEIADFLEARYEGDRELEIRGVRPLSIAGSHDLSFLANSRYAAQLKDSRAGAILVSEDQAGDDPRYLRVAKPYFALARVLHRWFSAIPLPDEGVAGSASIHGSAVIGNGVRVAAQVTIAEGAKIGDRCVLFEGARIGAGVVIGEDSILYPNVVVYHGCTIGRRVIIQGGAVIGGDGFGFATEGGIHYKIPQIGAVRIGDDVEVGANTTIDRGALEDTVIGDGTKIDNCVTVGHGARLGRGCMIVAGVGIAGSADLGDYVVIGGHGGVAGHIRVAGGTQIAANSSVMKSIRNPEVLAGIPARPIREYQKSQAAVRRIGNLMRRVRAVEVAVGLADNSGDLSGNDSDD